MNFEIADEIDIVTPTFPARTVPPVSQMAQGLIGSEILKIAADIRAMVAEGHTICNLTVGDFDPKYFPIPRSPANVDRSGARRRRNELSAVGWNVERFAKP